MDFRNDYGHLWQFTLTSTAITAQFGLLGHAVPFAACSIQQQPDADWRAQCEPGGSTISPTSCSLMGGLSWMMRKPISAGVFRRVSVDEGE